MAGSRPRPPSAGTGAYAWAGLGAAFGPVVMLSLFWQRMTRNGALAGFIAATIAIVVVSRLDKPPSEDLQATHQQVRASLKETGY